MTARFALLLALLLPLLPCTAAAASPAGSAPPPAALVEGEDYVVIEDGRPYAPVAGKIEVAEIFLYSCHHCASFDPIVEAWKARLPRDVQFHYVPLVYQDEDAFAQAFFAAQALGVLDRTHGETFKAMNAHDLPHNATIGELATFYAGLGVDEARFTAAATSPAVAASLAKARAFALGSGMEGTPALVVNGKYLVRGRNHQETLRIAGQLVARERAAGKRR